jgi:subtilisin-like proprotein convertase family protein
MLEANPSLTWRDVKHILATTSTQVDASNSKTYLTVNQYSWITNAANYKHHNWYGFGKVNAAAAVSSAQSYTAGSLGTAVNTGFVESGILNTIFNSYTRTTMNGDSDLVVAAPAGSSGIVEFVRIGVYMTHISPNDVGIELQSPDGTTVPILPAFTRVTTNPNGSVFEIGVNSLYGENMAGTWTLIVTDYTDDSVGGTLNGWDIKVYGR